VNGKNPKPTLYIPIEVKSRELESQIYLACIAVKLGFRVYLGSQLAINLIVKNKKSFGGIFLDKGGISDFWPLVKNKCDAIALLDQELSPAINDSRTLKREIPKRFINDNHFLCDKFFVAGPIIANAMIEFLGERNERVIETGWPRVELWRKFSKLEFGHTQDFSLLNLPSYLLYASDIGVISTKRIEAMKKLIANADTLQHERDYYDLSYSENLYRVFKEIVETLKIWDNNPDVPFIVVRPHPSEDTSVWEKELSGLSKTKVINHGSISQWLDQSIGLIHRTCTTAIEATIKGKLILNFASKNEDLAGNISVRLSDYEVSDSTHPTHAVIDSQIYSKFESKQEILKSILSTNLESAESIAQECLDMIRHAEPVIGKSILFRSKFSISYIKNSLGYFRWEVSWKLGKTPLEPPSISLPGGIRENDVGRILSSLDFSEEFSYSKVMKNLWKFE
jgi:surface carbohydrate biosynthesis protein